MRQINNIFDTQQVAKDHDDRIVTLKKQIESANIPSINPDQFFIAVENGANNAITGGVPVTIKPGTFVLVLLKHTLAGGGANTFNANPIKSHFNPANNIATGYVIGSIIQLIWDGTIWQDLSQ